MATLQAVVGAKIPKPSELTPGVPKALDAIVLKALARKREERFATAGDFQLALEDFLFKQQLPGTSAHLAAFLRELYAEELEEDRVAAEPTVIHYEPRLAAKPGPAPKPPARPAPKAPASARAKGAGEKPAPKRAGPGRGEGEEK
jgi:serine/threonine-protein kinase